MTSKSRVAGSLSHFNEKNGPDVPWKKAYGIREGEKGKTRRSGKDKEVGLMGQGVH